MKRFLFLSFLLLICSNSFAQNDFIIRQKSKPIGDKCKNQVRKEFRIKMIYIETVTKKDARLNKKSYKKLKKEFGVNWQQDFNDKVIKCKEENQPTEK